MATQVGAFEAKTKFSEILDRVAKGEKIIITRHEKAVARIVPASGISLDQVLSTIAKLRELRRSNILNPEGHEKLSIKDLVTEGRE